MTLGFEETGEAEFRPDEFSEGELSSEESGGVGESVLRPIGLCFDFFEVCGGSGVVTKRLASMGVVCGPILDLTYFSPLRFDREQAAGLGSVS